MKTKPFLFWMVIPLFLGTPIFSDAQSLYNFGSATQIATLPFTSVQNTSTITSDSVSCWGASMSNAVWYAITPNADTKVRFATSGSNFDTMMGVYPAEGWELTCNDDFNGTSQSQIQIALTAGQTYYVGIGSVDPSNSGGDLHFSAQAISPPLNDEAANAISVGALPFVYNEDGFAATVSPGDPSPSCGWGSNSNLWFVYDAGFTGNLEIDNSFGSYSYVAVYTGLPESLAEIRCSWTPRTILPVTAGTRYFVMIEAQGGYSFFDTLTTRFDVAPPALDFSVQNVRANVAPSNGTGTFSGTFLSNKPVIFSAFGRIRQSQAKGQAITYFYFYISCEANVPCNWTQPYSSQIIQHSGRSFSLFRGGKATLEMTIQGWDPDFQEETDKKVELPIQLKAGPSK